MKRSNTGLRDLMPESGRVLMPNASPETLARDTEQSDQEYIQQRQAREKLALKLFGKKYSELNVLQKQKVKTQVLSEAAKDEEPPADEASADGGEGGGEGEAPPADPKDLTVKFDHNRAHKYNKAEFTNNVGLVKKVTKDGLVVTVQPDQVDIFVNFDDLVENTTTLAKKFFRDKR